jgi:hypothetical protein
MPYPSGTYIAQIPDHWTREELEQFYSLLQGYLSAQHKETGAHSAITADSVTATGDGTFNGNVTADADGSPIVLGTFPGVSLRRAGNGIEMKTGTVSQWRLVTNNSAAGLRELMFQDLLAATSKPFAFQVEWDGTNYLLRPEAGSPLILGKDGTGTRLTDVQTADLHATNGLHERFRTAAVGERTAFTTTLTASAGTWTVGGGSKAATTAQIGPDLVFVDVDMENTSLSAAPTSLFFTVPYTWSASKILACPVNHGGAWDNTCMASLASGSANVEVFRGGGGAFTTGAGLYIRGGLWGIGS